MKKMRILARKELRDQIIDEHCMLLWIKFNSERLKMDRKGVPIANSRVGAVSFHVVISFDYY
jgi:hypothetical protein